jgi:Arc/MetJ-type ribon-helix-helix transcriptional regulator
MPELRQKLVDLARSGRTAASLARECEPTENTYVHPECSPSLTAILRRWYDGGMKTKTSVTLSEEVLRLIDRNAKGEKNRSAFIETAVRAYLEVIRRHRRDQEDLATINRLAEKLNAEAGDVLSFQMER